MEEPADKSIWDYVLSKENFSASKKKMYLDNITTFFYDSKCRKLVTSFTSMVKSGEIYSTSDINIINGCI